MKLYSILANVFKLDGGAMFGIVPKTLWNKDNIADEHNLVAFAARCLLIEDGRRLVLIDTGIGNKLPQKVASFYHIHPSISLEASLQKVGFHASDITDVILSHLHLDHAGGAVMQTGENRFESAFPKATYWTNKEQWEWATKNPNLREKASFKEENLKPLADSGQLRMAEDHPSDLPSWMDIEYVHGHTAAMMVITINDDAKRIIYSADLLPTVRHIPLIYTPAYDINPLLSIEEKESVFNRAIKDNAVFFLDHDERAECCSIQKTDKGFEVKNTFSLDEA